MEYVFRLKIEEDDKKWSKLVFFSRGCLIKSVKLFKFKSVKFGKKLGKKKKKK